MVAEPSAVVAGVDGCRAGWVVALAPRARRGRVTLRLVARIEDVLALSAVATAIDIPIGLPDSGARACDVDARRLLGPRRSSVFPAPVRACVGAPTYAAALAAHRSADGRGLSKQAFHLLPKIAEVDMALSPHLQRVVGEAHPELAFARLAGAPLAPKRTSEGIAARRALLRAELGIESPVAPRGSRVDDVLDAVVLTLTARRMAAGTANRLGDGAIDGTGLEMVIQN
jgi:predicted RNase H-like nuclease